MSGDCLSIYVVILHSCAQNKYSLFVYPILIITSRAICIKSSSAFEVISPLIMILFVVTNVSHATFELGSIAR